MHGFLYVITWICQSFCMCLLKFFSICFRPLPNKTKLKFDEDFKACFACFNASILHHCFLRPSKTLRTPTPPLIKDVYLKIKLLIASFTEKSLTWVWPPFFWLCQHDNQSNNLQNEVLKLLHILQTFELWVAGETIKVVRRAGMVCMESNSVGVQSGWVPPPPPPPPLLLDRTHLTSDRITTSRSQEHFSV